MRLLPGIGYGTEGYPEKVARRLRAVNIAARCGAVAALVFGLVQAFGPHPGLAIPAAINLVAAAVFAGIPLLHRFGAAAAPRVILSFGFLYFLALIPLLGTSTGMLVFFVLPPTLGVLFLGAEKPWTALILAVLAVVCMASLAFIVPDDTGLLPRGMLRASFVASSAIAIGVLVLVMHTLQREVLRAETAAERERLLSDALLASILPASVAERLRAEPGARVADRFDAVSVLFADMAGYTARAAEMPPAELVGLLDTVFGAFDGLVDRHGLEKIKTSGDSYLVVSGLPVPREDHAEALVRFALDLRDTAMTLRDAQGRAVPFRIGIASGPVVAGVVGSRRFFYDVWGDTVNMAARMETTGLPGRIQIAASTRALLGGGFALSARGPVAVRGKGEVGTWFVEGSAGDPAV